MTHSRDTFGCSLFKKSLLLSVGLSTLALPQMALAQDAAVPDEVVATGTRAVIQDSIALKRQNTQIVDGLSASEIGDIPALSIGEALETITGVASHRENGGATEVSIRGLGPYLSSTVFNGREATNGSGDRSVNFSQFPSELMSKLSVFKTQDASQIEGGVAGQIQLETLKPLDYNKRRVQVNLKGNVNPDQLNQDDTLAGDIGFRGTLSYVDQFEVNGLGDIGFSVGLQRSDISQPEQEIRSTSNTGSSSFACIVGGSAGAQGFTNNPSRDDDCEDQNESRTRDDGSRIPDGYDTAINPATGLAYSHGEDYVFVPSQRHYRQNDTRDERDSLFGALQWQPNDRLDVNFDVEWSERIQSEQRNDLTFNGQKRNDTSLNVGTGTNTTAFDSIEFSDTGAITSFTTDNTIEIQGDDYERKETYLGGGINVAYDLTERLSMSADVSFSETKRNEQGIQFRLQSDISPVISWNLDSGIPQYTLSDEVFDVNDHSNFVDRLRVRIDNDLERRNTSKAARLDFKYDRDFGIVNSLEVGGRYSELEYLALVGGGGQGRTEFELRNSTDTILTEEQNEVILAEANQNCRTSFAESDFLGSVRDGDLITNIDDSGAVISSTNSWATYDASCLVEFAVDAVNAQGGNFVFGIPDLERENSSTIDVTETVLAGYVMANYETTLDGLPMRGNFGVRVVDTSVDSVGYRQGYAITTNTDGGLEISPEGDLERVTAKGGYTEVLPSVNAIIDINDTVLFRAGAFRGISRADPADMGFARTFSFNSGDADDLITNVDDLISGVNASGNPDAKPLTSWNLDAGVEWYPNEDSIFAIGAYYKSFKGGFENVRAIETYVLDGQEVDGEVTLSQSNQDTSDLFGVEITASHRFSYLPGFLSGFGTKMSYNYTDSDFEFEDSLYGDLYTRELDGTLVQTNAGIVAPASIPGLSKHVFSGQLYYQIGNLDLQGLYKYRSDYFQPFTSNGTRIRYVGDVGVFEARASYKINDNFKVSVEAINLFDEPKEQYKWVPDDLYEVNVYGPRVFFGIQGKF
ncbi:TonB-dependent receptor [Litorimonas taeanensis]|uniref:TonB-dependent receptor n=1 Tax=Litorimonas taeanensis TaxID=568099 RepID=A0A420WLJ7_9PROT|nr:TonB-dependent receptor [Litorimonas taeanensis]RKQ71894.1 TonB-dependent receptor [Litorimonas taeanensis]